MATNKRFSSIGYTYTRLVKAKKTALHEKEKVTVRGHSEVNINVDICISLAILLLTALTEAKTDKIQGAKTLNFLTLN